jgi:hypothetical protein
LLLRTHPQARFEAARRILLLRLGLVKPPSCLTKNRRERGNVATLRVSGRYLADRPVRARRRVAQGFAAPPLVLGEVAIEEGELGVALEDEDVGRDAVEEPAVVGDDDRAASEALARQASTACPVC